MSEVLVVCDSTARTYGHGAVAVVAVHGASCTLDSSSRVALVGPSGSGKSTLLHLMAGLDSPTSGTVSWPSWPSGPFQDPSRVGLVFQGPSLIPSLSALENVAFPLLLQGMPHDQAAARARESLNLLDLGWLSDRPPEEMSGGQAQRVAVARVVTARPQLILADEPTGRLDRLAGEQVVDLLFDAAEHLSAGLVIATHDPAVADRMKEIWRMRDGDLRVAA
jgi:predicted ABC-type transport system involved in lysophospholipase L1 biosynthesis ATPase subunit